VKHLFYTILLLASLGIAGTFLNPSLIQQGATLIGLKLPQNSAEPTEKKSDEDQLAQFLAQYPFARQSNADTLPSTAVPMVVIPEPAQPAMPPVYSPMYANINHWDGEATTPIADVPLYDEPVATQHFPPDLAMDWSGPAQPIPAPQQSIYAHNLNGAPPPDPFSAVNDAPISGIVPPNFAQTKYVAPSPHSPNAVIQTPAVLIEDVPVYGTETVARVGRQVILMGDILPKLRRMAMHIVAENLKETSEEERAKTPPQAIEKFTNDIMEHYYPEVLQEQILFALVYSDFDMSRSRDEKNFFYEKLGEEFDRTEIPEMMKEFKVENIAALKKYLETQLGSSLEKERRLWIREQIVKQWMSSSMQRATGDCTHEEMRDFYDNNQTMFTTPAKARWQEMVVVVSKHNTEQEAFKKISWMGNQVAGGAPFDKIAEENSDGVTASKGGNWDWTMKEDLASPELERAIFTQPIGQLSPAIIRSDNGLHIIRVLERRREEIVPFVEAQGTIREEIKKQRGQRYQNEYFVDLRRRFPTQIVKSRIDFNVNNPRTANLP